MIIRQAGVDDALAVLDKGKSSSAGHCVVIEAEEHILHDDCVAVNDRPFNRIGYRLNLLDSREQRKQLCDKVCHIHDARREA